MRNLTVAAAAFTAGMMTFAANAQEAPPLPNADAQPAKKEQKAKATKTITISIGPEFHTYPVGATSDQEKKVEKTEEKAKTGKTMTISIGPEFHTYPVGDTADQEKKVEKAEEKAKMAKTLTVSIGQEFHTYPVGPIAGLEKKIDEMKTGSIAGRLKPDLKPAKPEQEKDAGATPRGRKQEKDVITAAPASRQEKETSVAASPDKQDIGAGFAAPARDPAAAAGGSYHAIISRYASSFGVPVSLAHAVIRIESNYRVNALGSAGEVGLMQIKPSTARMMGYSGSVRGLYDPETNIKYGMKYLAMAHQLGGGSTCRTILKYNAGHAAKRMNPVSSAYCSKVKRHLGS
jgi:hypothetical protein